MKFKMDDHLSLINIDIQYDGNRKLFHNILLDTGSSSTILDTDLCEEIGLLLDLAKRLHERCMIKVVRPSDSILHETLIPIQLNI